MGHRRQLTSPSEGGAPGETKRDEANEGAIVRSARLRTERLREALGGATRTVTGDGSSLELSLPSEQAPRTRASKLLHDAEMRAVCVAPSTTTGGFAAFLDGVQESRVVAYDGVVPIVRGRSAAVIRARVDRRLVTWGDGALTDDSLYVPLGTVGTTLHDALQATGFAVLDTNDESIDPDEAHPQHWLRRAVHLVQRGREGLERTLAEAWCAAEGDSLLYVDGGLPSSDVVLASARAVGVIKSHHTLYATGAALATIMALGAGERSSIFVVETGWRDPVASWYVRVRAAGGHDPFWGLVRVEYPLAPLTDGARDAAATADRISRWVKDEGSPLSLPDARWDTMAYGIRDCEVYLRATLGRLVT